MKLEFTGSLTGLTVLLVDRGAQGGAPEPHSLQLAGAAEPSSGSKGSGASIRLPFGSPGGRSSVQHSSRSV